MPCLHPYLQSILGTGFTFLGSGGDVNSLGDAGNYLMKVGFGDITVSSTTQLMS